MRKTAPDAPRIRTQRLPPTKRAIDGGFTGGDATERVDEFAMSLGLIDPATAGTDQPVARVGAAHRLNSETAGSMMDRMSIMALKIKAMTAQTRVPTSKPIARRPELKLARLNEQRDDPAPVSINCSPTARPPRLLQRSTVSSRCTPTTHR